MDNGPFSFAFIADPQIGMNSPHGLRGSGSDKERLERAIDYVNDTENAIDFVIFGGDQINEPDSREQLEVFMECAAELNVPYYGVAGNHDQYDPRERSSIYLEREAPERFAFVHKKTLFVGLNASKLRGDYGDEYQEREWQHLSGAFDRLSGGCVHRFVVLHHPLFCRDPHEPDDYWNMPNRLQLIEFFRDRGVSCVLSGHWQKDIEAMWRGVGLVTSVGTSLPLQGPEELSFKVVTVFGDGWLARGCQSNAPDAFKLSDSIDAASPRRGGRIWSSSRSNDNESIRLEYAHVGGGDRVAGGVGFCSRARGRGSDAAARDRQPHGAAAGHPAADLGLGRPG
jgi:hypothetical protein